MASLDLEVAGGFLASIRDDFVFDLLTLIEGAEAGAFDRRDMNEHVPAAATSRLNKTIAFGRVEPFILLRRTHEAPSFVSRGLPNASVADRFLVLPSPGVAG